MHSPTRGMPRAAPWRCAISTFSSRRISIARAAAAGERLLRGLRTLESMDGVGHVRGLGLMAAVEVVADKTTKQLFPPEAGMTQKLMDTLLDRGLYTRVALDCICLAPPFVATDADIDRIVETVMETISRRAGGAGGERDAEAFWRSPSSSRSRRPPIATVPCGRRGART